MAQNTPQELNSIYTLQNQHYRNEIKKYEKLEKFMTPEQVEREHQLACLNGSRVFRRRLFYRGEPNNIIDYKQTDLLEFNGMIWFYGNARMEYINKQEKRRKTVTKYLQHPDGHYSYGGPARTGFLMVHKWREHAEKLKPDSYDMHKVPIQGHSKTWSPVFPSREYIGLGKVEEGKWYYGRIWVRIDKYFVFCETPEGLFYVGQQARKVIREYQRREANFVRNTTAVVEGTNIVLTRDTNDSGFLGTVADISVAERDSILNNVRTASMARYGKFRTILPNGTIEHEGPYFCERNLAGRIFVSKGDGLYDVPLRSRGEECDHDFCKEGNRLPVGGRYDGIVVVVKPGDHYPSVNSWNRAFHCAVDIIRLQEAKDNNDLYAVFSSSFKPRTPFGQAIAVAAYILGLQHAWIVHYHEHNDLFNDVQSGDALAQALFTEMRTVEQVYKFASSSPVRKGIRDAINYATVFPVLSFPFFWAVRSKVDLDVHLRKAIVDVCQQYLTNVDHEKPRYFRIPQATELDLFESRGGTFPYKKFKWHGTRDSKLSDSIEDVKQIVLSSALGIAQALGCGTGRDVAMFMLNTSPDELDEILDKQQYPRTQLEYYGKATVGGRSFAIDGIKSLVLDKTPEQLLFPPEFY